MHPFSQYAKSIDNVCFLYNGLIPEYVVQLDYLLPFLRKSYPDLKFGLVVRDEFICLSYYEATPRSQVLDGYYSFVKEFKTNPSGPHPILNFIQGTSISFPKLELNQGGTICLICPDAAYPSNPMTSQQVDRAKQFIKSNGCEPIVVQSDLHPTSGITGDIRPSGLDKLTLVTDACWVVGAENEFVFMAAARGIRSGLIPTGNGTELYKLMFPHGEVYERI
jgi:hypothetical protein